MKRLSLLLVVPVFVLLFLVPAPSAVDADVVRLRTGVNVKGKAREDLSDTDTLVFEDFLTGAIRRYVWSVVDPKDRKRLWVDWGWEDASRRTVQGHRIRRRQATGDTIDILGLALNREGDPIRIMRGGREIDIPAQDIVVILDEEMDPRDIWSPEQLYERKMKELEEKGADRNSLTSDQHWLLAETADWAEHLEKAKEHYEACANDANFLRNTVAGQRLTRVEALLRDQAAMAQLREIRMAIGLKSFRRARSLLESFEAEHTEASEPVKRRVEKTKKYFDETRDKYFQRETRARFFKDVRSLIGKKVREKEITYSDAFAYTRRDLAEEAFALTAEHLNRKDDITVEQAKAFWDARPKKTWWSASYGGGTFIARPPKMKKVNKKKRARPQKRSGANSGPAPKTPPKPTRDSWWAKAKSKERAAHMLARFAEDSALFEVSETEYPSVCPICNARGVEQKTLSNGQLWTYTCTRCAGAQNDIKIRFR